MIYELFITSDELTKQGKGGLITYFECDANYSMDKIKDKVRKLYPSLTKTNLLIEKKEISSADWLKQNASKDYIEKGNK